MTAFYVLDASPLNNQVRIAVHIEVPAGNNDAGRPWRDVLVEYSSDRTSQVPWLAQASKDALVAGELHEVVINVDDDAKKTTAQRVTAVRAAVTSTVSNELARLSNVLRFWGHEGSV